MKALRTFQVAPYLPAALEPLRFLAHNLHFSWSPTTKQLFRAIQPQLWDECQHNPVQLLGRISQSRLNEVAEDESFLTQMRQANLQLQEYLDAPTWYQKQRSTQGGQAAECQECFAYFSAEFGLAECLPIYSGGLGILAGDHLKSASDLGLPLVGIGLLYQKGYFRQYLNPDGWQQERYPINDFYNMPMQLEKRPDGSELRIRVDYPNRPVFARIWRVDVGRLPLYLLDTNIETNSQYDQNITDELYGGDKDLRIHQEIMLGIGGVRALKALGIKPTLFHMNEGHSAFLGLERIRQFMDEEELDFTAAFQAAKSSQIFTTHTPVPAGIDLFDSDKIDYYLGSYYRAFRLSREQFMGLGRENTGDFQAPFSMAVLAINTASFVNGVSKLHSRVSQRMFGSMWQNLPTQEVPIVAVTNGIHTRTWVGDANQELFDRHLGREWSSSIPSSPLWEQVNDIPDGELWRIHEEQRAKLVDFTRQRLHDQLAAQGASPAELMRALKVLDPKALTIGFARRFATYKRATLLLRDRDRLLALLTNPERPVQFIFAGKAHPKDNPGKELIREIVQFSRDEAVRDRIVFIEDYDMFVTSLMVVGADVWLNTPRRPREASGTSGMKAAANGLLNLSILDGWWGEADYYNTGWAIGRGEDYFNAEYQDKVESTSLYDLIEHEVVPSFYGRNEEGLPQGWIGRMKNSIRTNGPQFSTERMVRDYAEQAYFPVSDYFERMKADGFTPSKALVEWQDRLLLHWYHIEIEKVVVDPVDRQETPLPVRDRFGHDGAIAAAVPVLSVGDKLTVTAHLHLGQLQPEDVLVEIYQGGVDETGDIPAGVGQAISFTGMEGDLAVFQGEVHYSHSGLQGLGLRLLPYHPDLHNRHELRLIRWAE